MILSIHCLLFYLTYQKQQKLFRIVSLKSELPFIYSIKASSLHTPHEGAGHVQAANRSRSIVGTSVGKIAWHAGKNHNRFNTCTHYPSNANTFYATLIASGFWGVWLTTTRLQTAHYSSCFYRGLQYITPRRGRFMAVSALVLTPNS